VKRVVRNADGIRESSRVLKMIEKSYVGLEVMLRCNEPMELVAAEIWV
jgi:hypothetical protein